MTDNTALLPLFYLPPVQWFSTLKNEGSHALVEHHEHFPKQTFRNRAHIYSPNGLLALSVPVKKGAKNHTPYREVEISYESNWQRLHWMSLQACYRSSAYFEFYEDDFAPFYQKRYDRLFDLNWNLLQLLLALLKMPSSVQHNTEYKRTYSNGTDYRTAISHKKENAYAARPYYQVFEERHGFLPDLSIVDLLFSQGPQSQQYL